MKKLIHHGALAFVFLAASSCAWATATVTFDKVEKMTDVPRDQSDRESMEAAFRELLNTLSAGLPAGQELKVEFVDIDLAGDVFPRVAIQNVRVYKGRADWPRIHLRYSVEQDGKVLRSGDRQLSDPNYQMSFNHYKQDMYGYEKQMLEDWYRKEITAKR